MKKIAVLLLLIPLVVASASKTEFVTVKGTSFFLGKKKYKFVGTNYWYGVNLASKGEGGDRERLLRELDHFQKLGITNLRIMAGSEGPDEEPYRVKPSMQPAPGKYNSDQEDALDFLLAEMKKRNIYAVVCLTNFWNWSGGIPQYLVWSGAADSIPYPPPHPGGDWQRFQLFSASFYSNPKAIGLLNNHIRHILERTNRYTGIAYKEDPTIMAWELANEPRGLDNIADYRKWINSTAALIKSLDKNHLVTTGSEGITSSRATGNDPYEDHLSKDIDYVAVHLWVENWGIYKPEAPDKTFDKSVAYAKEYINEHIAISKKLNKPMVLEEFGIGRDYGAHDPASATTYRDRYYQAVFDHFYTSTSNDGAIAGVNVWGWAGEGLPTNVKGMWSRGDTWIGDPPHENQGWYSIYATDKSTLDVISGAAKKVNALCK
jgi:mannan endo-1,4-beta-mannosidase